ncbi:hypothetical protein [Cyanothece sp. BG0011]|nr:hypothetical protein [Cyanothece sp. BG0011]
MKLTVILIHTVIVASFLTGVGLTLDKIETASLSNPFRVRTAQLNKTH